MNALLYNAPPLVTFMFVMSITPGPNNLMLLGSGARFGLRRTLPHLLGITSGFLLVQFVTFAGLGAVILAYPSLKSALTVACVVYLLWLGYKLLLAGDPNDATSAPARNSAGRPLSFWEATIFQLVNPKAWGAAVPAIGIVARDALSPTYGLLLLLGVSLIVGPPGPGSIAPSSASAWRPCAVTGRTRSPRPCCPHFWPPWARPRPGSDSSRAPPTASPALRN